MDPKRDYEKFDTETTRAFITLFRNCADQFQFAADPGVQDTEEVRAYIYSPTDLDVDTAVGITAINEKERFNTIVTTMEDMELVVNTNSSVKQHEQIGEYHAYTATAYAPSNITASWNVPHLLIYGSLNPEIEEVYTNVFGNNDDVNIADVRNHFVLFGSEVTEETRNKLASAVDRSTHFFSDQKRDIMSDIHTADLV